MSTAFKRVFVVWLWLAATAPSTYSQGQVNFANFAVGVDAPIVTFFGGSGSRLTGPTYAAQLFFAQPGSGNNISSYTPLSGVVPFSSGRGAGYFLGGAKAIPGFYYGSQVSLIVAAFSTTGGASDYYSALVTPNSCTGYSRPVVVTLNGFPIPPPNMVGLSPFGVGFSSPCPIPEPSVSVYILSGLALLLGVRRANPLGSGGVRLRS